jgi:acyl carrier protein
MTRSGQSRMTDPASATLGQTIAMVHSILAGGLLAAGDQLSIQSNLIEAGLDSMAVAQLLLEIEERTGMWLDESLLTPDNLATCETLGRCVHGVLMAKRDRS